MSFYLDNPSPAQRLVDNRLSYSEDTHILPNHKLNNNRRLQ